MARSHTTLQVLHDVGAAAWFGGSLMGAVGLNGAAADVSDPADRPRVAASGWGRWAPVSALAIAAHGVGAVGLLVTERDRVRKQSGVRANSVVKTVATVAALGVTAWSGVLGAKVGSAGRVPAAGGTTPSEGTPSDVSAAQQQLTALQWALPVLTGTVVGLGAQQSQQQRPQEQVAGRLARLRRSH